MWVAGWFLMRVFQCWKRAGESISTQNSTHLQQTTCFDNESKIKVPDIKLLIILFIQKKTEHFNSKKSEIKVKDIKLIGDIKLDRDSGFHEGMKNIGGGEHGAHLECATQNPLRGQPLAPAQSAASRQPSVFWVFRGWLAFLAQNQALPKSAHPTNE